MTQKEAVIQIMRKNGGFATLNHLYKNVLKVSDCVWNTKTPFSSVRRIVQDEKFFYKIKPGLWALIESKNKLPQHITDSNSSQFGHTYFQGLMAEIGNFQNFETYVPAQDSKKDFLNLTLSDITSLKKIYPFSYEWLVRKAQTIDTVWFNERKMPEAFIEVEHTTSFKNSLTKFIELQDFNSKFYIISDISRKNQFEKIICGYTFKDIIKRVKFFSYEDVEKYHNSASEFSKIQEEVSI